MWYILFNPQWIFSGIQILNKLLLDQRILSTRLNRDRKIPMLKTATQNNKAYDTNKEYDDQSHQTSNGQIELILNNGYVGRHNVLYSEASVVVLKKIR